MDREHSFEFSRLQLVFSGLISIFGNYIWIPTLAFLDATNIEKNPKPK